MTRGVHPDIPARTIEPWTPDTLIDAACRKADIPMASDTTFVTRDEMRLWLELSQHALTAHLAALALRKEDRDPSELERERDAILNRGRS